MLLSQSNAIIILSGSEALSPNTEQASGTMTGSICPVCLKNFQNPRNAYRHYETVHLKLKKFECPLCGKRFGQKATAKAHMLRVHGGERQ